ncbi:MAG: tryptophan synthase subunit alpha [Saprospiraceae bacterium]
MKSIRQTIIEKGNSVLNVYFTAGHPTLDSVVPIIEALEKAGVDLIELGMPYSDPLADGPTIQQSSEKALANGQTIKNLFSQVSQVRKTAKIPIIIMGYYNQMLQYGVDKFVIDAHESGVQGLIIPDLPMDIYSRDYLQLFEKYKMEICFLVTPMTSPERVRQADQLSSGFLYIVSQSSITGKKGGITEDQKKYFTTIKTMGLQSPTLIGFGIHDKATRDIANQYSHGAIVGSAFIRALDIAVDIPDAVTRFIAGLNE